MSIAVNETRPAAASKTGLAHQLRCAFDRLHRAWIERRTVSTLSSLDDATLKDIGLERSDIPWLAAGLAQGIDRRPPYV